MFRAIFMTFFGEYRGGAPAASTDSADDAQRARHAAPHESPLVMALPLLVLAVPGDRRRLRQLPGTTVDRRSSIC